MNVIRQPLLELSQREPIVRHGMETFRLGGRGYVEVLEEMVKALCELKSKLESDLKDALTKSPTIRIETPNADLLEAAKAIVDDYEHCAPNADGVIEPFRKRLIKQLRAAIAKAES